jgi:DNA-binding response OmpR family regulator
MYRTVFEREGFAVMEAVDGESGWQQTQEGTPDLILLDLHLPRTHGFDVLQQIRADDRTRAIPVLILSVLDDERTVRKALDMGANDYAAKGLAKPREIVGKIRALLAKHDVMRRIPTYHVFVADQRGDAGRLQSDVGLTEGFTCPGCRTRAMSLELLPDFTRAGRWFVGRFVCQSCGRTV